MKKINGKKFKEILLSGANAMSNNIERIDALNVFPVPDGDTGSNMGATIIAAYDFIKNNDSNNIGNITSKLARGMLLGARGNSGVILSQIFKGMSVGLQKKESASVLDIIEAFKLAKEYGYKSVMEPIEGTILTVIKMISDDLQKKANSYETILDLFKAIVKQARLACDETPNLLPVLKEVGVTDSGGEGLFLILEGMMLALEGKPVDRSKTQSIIKNSGFDFFDSKEDFNGEFGYCTEFIVELDKPKQFNKSKFEEGLQKLGSSIVIVKDEEILKVHLHAPKPGKAFNYAQRWGEFLKIKSENMTLQANESSGLKKHPKPNKSNEKLNIGIIACHVGQGIIEEARKLGVDFIIEGGQTMNPSASDFIDAIKEINSDKIIILPNNSNIILAAQQVAQTIVDKDIIIINTKTQMQGLTALMNFNREGTIEENKEEMMESISSVKTGQITLASRTTRIEGVHVREGEYLAIADRKIIKSTNSKVASAIAVSKKLINDETEIVAIYYGDDSTQTDAKELASYLETHYDVEIEIKNGEQPVYNFLMSFE